MDTGTHTEIQSQIRGGGRDTQERKKDSCTHTFLPRAYYDCLNRQKTADGFIVYKATIIKPGGWGVLHVGQVDPR